MYLCKHVCFYIHMYACIYTCILAAIRLFKLHRHVTDGHSNFVPIFLFLFAMATSRRLRGTNPRARHGVLSVTRLVLRVYVCMYVCMY